MESEQNDFAFGFSISPSTASAGYSGKEEFDRLSTFFVSSFDVSLIVLQEAAIDFAAVREELDDITEDVERPTVDDGLANDEDKELLTDKLPYVSRRLLQFLSLKTFFDESSCTSGICRLTLLPKFRL